MIVRMLITNSLSLLREEENDSESVPLPLPMLSIDRWGLRGLWLLCGERGGLDSECRPSVMSILWRKLRIYG